MPGAIAYSAAPAGTPVLGTVLIVVLLAAVTAWMLRLAARRGLLAPVLAGLALRLVVMLAAHLGSQSYGDGGYMFLDDLTLSDHSRVLAFAWSQGHFVNPADFSYIGSYELTFPLLETIVFLIVGTPTVLGVKVVNVLLGTATILAGARLAGQVLGERARLRMAWVVALMPTLIWWSGTMLKEPLVALVMTLAISELVELPRRRAWVGCVVSVVVLTLTRAAAAMAFVAGIVAVLVIRLWGAYRRGDQRAAIRTAGVAGLLVSAGIVAGLLERGVFRGYVQTAKNMFHLYQGGNIVRLPYDTVKTLLTPVPWAFDHQSDTWDRGLYPGVWVLYAMAPSALIGAWALRRAAPAVLVTMVTFLLANSAVAGLVFRQRSTVEPLICLCFVAGIGSWARACRLGAAALVVVGLAAGAHERSPGIAVLVCLGAAVLAAVSWRLAPSTRTA